MSLAKLIHRNKNDEVSNQNIQINKETSSTLAKIASLALANTTSGTIDKDIQKIKTMLCSIGEPVETHCSILDKCKRDPEALSYYRERANESKREERRAKVLAILAENPKTQRAIITDLDNDPDNAILTIGIRDQCTFEMTIPKNKYDAFLYMELINRGPAH